MPASLATAGHADRRRRVLTGEATVHVVPGLCLFSGEGYDTVLGRTVPLPADSAPPPAASLADLP
ncbi:transposase domain-containing protein [Actinacidiphila soli]|uniref:transposase domain-containing protein n=1 Tax=Actinacidiphila soli TaxID=2487275 RepID=UPI0013E387E6|nr:transposase domain-containing protein [Actinacidiphila soli]